MPEKDKPIGGFQVFCSRCTAANEYGNLNTLPDTTCRSSKGKGLWYNWTASNKDDRLQLKFTQKGETEEIKRCACCDYILYNHAQLDPRYLKKIKKTNASGYYYRSLQTPLAFDLNELDTIYNDLKSSRSSDSSMSSKDEVTGKIRIEDMLIDSPFRPAKSYNRIKKKLILIKILSNLWMNYQVTLKKIQIKHNALEWKEAHQQAVNPVKGGSTDDDRMVPITSLIGDDFGEDAKQLGDTSKYNYARLADRLEEISTLSPTELGDIGRQQQPSSEPEPSRRTRPRSLHRHPPFASQT